MVGQNVVLLNILTMCLSILTMCLLLVNVTLSPVDGYRIMESDIWGIDDYTNYTRQNKLYMVVLVSSSSPPVVTLECSIRGALRLAFRKIEKDVLPGNVIKHVKVDTLSDPGLGVTYMLNVLHPLSPPQPITTDIVIGEQCR